MLQGNYVNSLDSRVILEAEVYLCFQIIHLVFDFSSFFL